MSPTENPVRAAAALPEASKTPSKGNDEDTYKFGVAPPVYKEVFENGDTKVLSLLTPDYAEYVFEKMFVNKEKYGMPFTDGTWWSNFVMHVKNEHSVLSCCFAHPEAPFSDTERQAFLFLIWSWNFIFTTIFVNSGIGKAANIIITNILILILSTILREVMECTCCYNSGYEASGFKEAYTICFSLLETVANFWVFVFCLGTLIFVIVMATLKNADGEYIADPETYLISQLNSSITTEFLKLFVLHYFFFEKNKQAFEDRWAPYFAEGDVPVNICDVGKRAKQNFLWDPIVYGRTANTAIVLLEKQYEVLGKENAVRQKNGEASHNGYAIPSRELAASNFEQRWKDYSNMFNFPSFECNTGTRPPGAVDGARPAKRAATENV